MIVGVDASGVTVGKRQLNRVLPYGSRRLRAGLGLEHGQRGGRSEGGRSFPERFFFDAFIVARRAGTILAQICKIEMAGVTVGPGNVHTRAGAYVNFHAGGLAALVDGNGHGRSFQ